MKQTTNYNLEFTDNNLKLIKQIIKTAEKNKNENKVFINDYSVEDYLLSFNTSIYTKLSKYLSSIQYQYLADSFQVLPFVRGLKVEPTDQKGRIFNDYIEAKTYHEKLRHEKQQLKFEVGKWYSNNEELFYCTEIDIKDNKVLGYGFNYTNHWLKESRFSKLENHLNFKLATDEEVKERLLKYAKENYSKGTKFKELDNKYHGNYTINKTLQINEAFVITENICNVLYRDGKWAEIIEKPLFKDINGKYWYKSDFKENEVYYCEFHDGDRIDSHIFKMGNDLRIAKTWFRYSNKSDKNYYDTNSGNFTPENGMINYRKATQEEIEWLERCEKAGKFVEKEQKPLFVSDDNIPIFKNRKTYRVNINTINLINCKWSGKQMSSMNNPSKDNNLKIKYFFYKENAEKYLKKLRLDEIKEKELLKSWEELGSIKGSFVLTNCDIDNTNKAWTDTENRNIFPTKEQAEASIALAQLLQLRDVYRDSWKPDWDNKNQTKYTIILDTNHWVKYKSTWFNRTFVFQSEEIRDKFFENFKDLLEKVKPLFI